MVAAATMVLGLIWFTCASNREPRYNGRSLSQWLDLCAATSDPSQEAADAVRHIGTNAVPFLVTWTQQTQGLTPWKQRCLVKVLNWKREGPGKELLVNLITAREPQEWRSACGFAILGEAAQAAAPDLARIAAHGNDASADIAIYGLTLLGRNGLESLFSVITNTAAQKRSRIVGMDSLRRVVPLATAFVPELTKLLSDQDPFVRSQATNVINAIAPEVLQQSSVP